MKKSYYENTKNREPHHITQKFINLNIAPGKAIELGCGAGNDTVALIKRGWHVTAIDSQNTQNYITSRLTEKEQKNLTFIQDDFTKTELSPCTLVVANYSLPFCHPSKFKNLWKKITNCIFPYGYFVGCFFGINDQWNKENKPMTFHTKDEVLNLFKDFEILHFKEMDEDAVGGNNKMKHWHVFFVIGKKVKTGDN